MIAILVVIAAAVIGCLIMLVTINNFLEDILEELRMTRTGGVSFDMKPRGR